MRDAPDHGKTLPQACKEAEIVEQTYYRWRKEYGGLTREAHQSSASDDA